jgi:hypothetical protein
VVSRDNTRAFRTVSDAAAVAAELISQSASSSRIWRFVFAQLLDDYSSVLRHRGVEAASALWAAEPPTTGDGRVDAAFAALAEHLARRDRWRSPAWAGQPGRESFPWWFVTDLRGLHPRALVESPLSFRRRGVFITRDALERV